MQRIIINLVLIFSLATGILFAAPVGEVEAQPNGCGPELLSLYVVIPDSISWWDFWYGTQTFDFGSACDAHDICYSGSGIARSTCDERFYYDMLAECSTGRGWAARNFCAGMAWTYYQAVATFGWVAYTP